MVFFAKYSNVPLEVNESSLVTNECGGRKRMEFWLQLAKEQNCIIYLGSDAHFSKEIGIFNNAIELLEKYDYPEELIINCNQDLLNKYFN